MTTVTSVDFHFDVMCPYSCHPDLACGSGRCGPAPALEINWRFFSLEEVNRQEGKKHPWEREWSYGWSMMRIGRAPAPHRHGPDLDRWYEVAGRALDTSTGTSPTSGSVARALLGRLDLDPDLVDQAIADPTTGDEVLAEHRRVVDRRRATGSPHRSSPTGSACSVPCWSTRRRAPAAERLWDAVVAWARVPPPLRAATTEDAGADERHIVETFRPYLEARDWVSIDRGEIITFPPGSGGG